MAKPVFNEAEKFVINTYSDVRLLEETLQKVRDKYREEIQRIGEQVQEKYPELDFFDDQFKAIGANGCMVFSRSVWAGDRKYPSGLHLNYLRLDNLVSPQSEPPCAYLWTKPSRRAGVDMVATRRALWRKLPQVLTAEELKKCESDDGNEDVPVGWPMATQQEVLGWLIGDQIDQLGIRVMEQVGIFIKMVPILDEYLIMGKSTKGKQG